MKTMLKSALLATLTAASTQAAVVLSETFSYPNGALIGQGSLAWAGLGTPVSTTNPLTVSAGTVPLLTTGQDASRPLTTAVSFTGGASIYYSLDVTLSAAQATGDYFFAYTVTGTDTNYKSRLFAKSTTGGFVLGLAESNLVTTYGTGVLTFNTPYKLVMTYNSITGASNDTLALYVSPTSAIEGSNVSYVTQTSTATTEATGLGAVALRQGTTANAPTLVVDNIIVATTFHEAAGLAAPVPEPSSAAALAGLVVLGAVATRRRRA